MLAERWNGIHGRLDALDGDGRDERAPQSASSRDAQGAATACSTATTVTPVNGSVVSVSVVLRGVILAHAGRGAARSGRSPPVDATAAFGLDCRSDTPATVVTEAAGAMLKGSRVAVLRKIQPVSIHGQISLDVFFSDADDPDGPVSVARVGDESVPRDLEPGDRIELQYLMGVVTAVRKAD